MRESGAARIGRLHLALAGGDGARFADTHEIQLALWLEARFPGTGAQFAAACGFHARAARWAVAQDGAAGVVFGAAYVPCAAPPHCEALEAAPNARFVYADFGSESTFVNAGLLAGPSVAAVRATVRDPSRLMALPEVEALGTPVQLQLQLCGHFWPASMCLELTRRYADLLSPGSTLAMTLWSPDGTAAGEEFLGELAAAAGWPAFGHSAAAVAGWFGDAGLRVLGAGVSDVRAYERGDWAEQAGLAGRSPGRIVKVVGRKL